ncbi:MAG: histidinol-phosphatase [Ruminococcus sp.]|uniref:histidinol-phosphatase n=1 Tax=Ruminococcus sp. TaxID=41978 RepID=UPI002873591D|nr:histidinol-phosphatase [Ruminococcus sp.]MBQ3284623.1 histidinol-phosphatase [Ruminococcus sp.]
MITKDLHMHTAYCDGKDAPEDMILSAIDKGLTTVGISGHSYTFFDESYCMQKADIPRYISELHYLRAKYFDRIRVLCGVEQDYYSDYPTDEFDYVIGSVHYVKVEDAYIPVDESPEILKEAAEKYYGGDIYALCEQYFETVADVADRTDCDIIGHFDLISKFIEKEPLFDVNHPRYVAAWQYAVDELLIYDIPFEINTGAISRGYKTQPYPSADMIAYIREHGGRFVLSSDAHSADNVAYQFEKYEALI